MSEPDNVMLGLELLAARGASGIATQGSIAGKSEVVGGPGFAPGRLVYDTVTGQVVTVIGSTTAYVPMPAQEK